MVGIVALLHFGFLVLEMFLWNHPIGHRTFGMTPDVAASSAVLASNQGLYNGFLAVGLLWGLIARRNDVTLFVLGCVVIAGIYGGLTAKVSIIFLQALPAMIAFALVYLSGRSITLITESK